MINDKNLERKFINVVLYNDEKTLALTIGFFGFTYEDIEKYLTKTFIESKKEYAQKYTQIKYA